MEGQGTRGEVQGVDHVIAHHNSDLRKNASEGVETQLRPRLTAVDPCWRSSAARSSNLVTHECDEVSKWEWMCCAYRALGLGRVTQQCAVAPRHACAGLNSSRPLGGRVCMTGRSDSASIVGRNYHPVATKGEWRPDTFVRRSLSAISRAKSRKKPTAIP